MTHKQGLMDQLYKCNEPALVLHIACLIIYTIATGTMLHASGKFVSSILDFLSIGHLSDDESALLFKFHELVLLHFKADSEETKSEITDKLDEIIPKAKDIAANFKKVKKDDED